MPKTLPAPSAPNDIFKPYPTDGGKRPAVEIAPSMLSSNFARADRELALCRRARARWIHIDVMDGHFVPNLTLGPPILRKWSAAEPELFYDTHLMIENPLALAEEFVKAGSGILTLHIETLANPRRDLRAVRRLGVRVGITLKPKTPVREILPLLGEVDMVLVMTVEPGFGGQQIIPKALNKVRELDLERRKGGHRFRLQVDGGINLETAPMAVAAGADVLVAGNAVFSGHVGDNIKGLRAAAAHAIRPANGG